MNFKNIFTFKNLIFLLLIILTLKFVSNIFGIFMLFFAAFVLASSLEPLVSLLQKKMDRSLATIIVMCLSLITTVAVLIPILRLAIKQIIAFSATIPERVATIHDFLINSAFIGKFNFAEVFDLSAIIGTTGELAKNIVDSSLQFTIGFFNFIIFLIAVLMIMFYFIKDRDYISKKFIEFFPSNLKEKARCVMGAISEKVGGYVIAQLVSNIAIWVMVTVVLALFGVDYAVVLGLIAGALDIVPVLGPTIAFILIVIGAYQLGAVKLIAIIICFLIIQQISNSFVRPIVFGRFLDLHPLVILLSILICAQFLGILAVVLAPAIAATVCVLIDELYLLPMNSENDKDYNE